MLMLVFSCVDTSPGFLRHIFRPDKCVRLGTWVSESGVKRVSKRRTCSVQLLLCGVGVQFDVCGACSVHTCSPPKPLLLSQAWRVQLYKFGGKLTTASSREAAVCGWWPRGAGWLVASKRMERFDASTFASKNRPWLKPSGDSFSMFCTPWT